MIVLRLKMRITRAWGRCTCVDTRRWESSLFPSRRYIELSNNERTNFKARELKSIHVDAEGIFLKLIIHKNYVNRLNLYNQVSIVAINLLGDDLDKVATLRNSPSNFVTLSFSQSHQSADHSIDSANSSSR